ncbi:phosphate ABC transporter substrate-binding protein PstS [Microlunatus sp. Gsoil 973]|uniref:phosphate ABC transporter substrate-binding protein PstS n=1 Tax=Microlunatus sp. Gsoil 973 TaxID=2672569 RepID=UPI0012B4DC28|nr:phosphate ABC transporter substrate-binding protein PstS [Microlunatus sp. Gsoil 973]QGN33744.1 phosphate ABC transporter substrate-binding protein PstS [Microlunatus sp. Gsoil 973]
MKLKRLIIPAVLAASFGLAACGGNAEAGTGTTPTGATPTGTATAGQSSPATNSAPTELSGKIAAGGSSAQQVAQQVWRAGFSQQYPDVTISYDPVGSGTGQENFVSGAYTFAGSDSVLDDATVAKANSQCGGDPIEFPVYVSPIAVAYHLDGVTSLNLDAETVAKIFSGRTTRWNDPAITRLNAGVNLPNTTITPVHRSDSSGTTWNFTDYLHQAAPKAWKSAADTDWPSTKGESAEGTSGVVGAAQGGNGTIAYIDDSGVRSTKLSVAKIKVGPKFVAPSAEGAAAALASSEQIDGTASSILTFNLNRTTTDPGEYPIFMASNVIACQSYDDPTTTAIIKAWLSHVISADGQKAAAANAYSAPLPSEIVAKEQAIVDQMG